MRPAVTTIRKTTSKGLIATPPSSCLGRSRGHRGEQREGGSRAHPPLGAVTGTPRPRRYALLNSNLAARHSYDCDPHHTTRMSHRREAEERRRAHYLERE